MNGDITDADVLQNRIPHLSAATPHSFVSAARLAVLSTLGLPVLLRPKLSAMKIFKDKRSSSRPLKDTH